MLLRDIARLTVLGASLVILGSGAALAQASPTPKPPAPTPNPFTYGGTIRAFYFTRSNLVQNAGNPNRTAFNLGGKLHGEYHFGTTPFTAGATYFGADPLGANGANPRPNP